MPIPDWTAEGILPPVDARDPTAPFRSPYAVTLTDAVLRFGTSEERRRILHGYLSYREQLRKVGIMEGFQWLNGSFSENVELNERRPPNDVDVVTFYHLPDGHSEESIFELAPELFSSSSTKKQYFVDAYQVNLGSPPNLLVEQAAYWYSVWSHRRTMAWKGFVQIDLDPTSNAEAAELLMAIKKEGEGL